MPVLLLFSARCSSHPEAMPLTVKVSSTIDPAFKEIEIPFMTSGISVRKGGLYIRDEAGVTGVLPGLAAVNNNAESIGSLFIKDYFVTGALDVPEDLRTKLEVPMRDLQPLTNSIRAFSAEHGMEAPEILDLAGRGRSNDAMVPFRYSTCSKEAKALPWLLMGAPRSIPSPGTSVATCLALVMLPDQGPRNPGVPQSEDSKTHKVMLRVTKGAIGQLIGTRGAARRAIEEELGTSFEIQCATDFSDVSTLGDMSHCHLFCGVITDALAPRYKER